MSENSEITYYGLAYLDTDGQMQYKFSEQYMELHQFTEQCVWNGLYSTPIISCKAEELNLKLDLHTNIVAKIHDKYGAFYLHAVKSLGDISSNDSTFEIIIEEQEQLLACLNFERLQMFEGMVVTALKSKVLTLQKAQEFIMWVHSMQKQMDEKKCCDNMKMITFYGFAYDGEDGYLHYYAGDDLETVCKEKAKHDGYAMFTTPVFQKAYCIQAQKDISSLKELFLCDFMQLFFGGYLDCLRLIKQFPSDVAERDFDRACDAVKNLCSQDAYEAFLAYGFRWNIKQY